jgi:hypothetical protein
MSPRLLRAVFVVMIVYFLAVCALAVLEGTR